MKEDRIIELKKIIAGNAFIHRQWIYIENESEFINNIIVFTKDLGLSGSMAYQYDEPIQPGTYSITDIHTIIVEDIGIISTVLKEGVPIKRGDEYIIPRLNNMVYEYYLPDYTKIVNYQITKDVYIFATTFSNLILYNSTDLNTNPTYLFPIGIWDDTFIWYDELYWLDSDV